MINKIQNLSRYLKYSYGKLPTRKKLCIPLIIGFTPFCVNLLASLFLPIYWPHFALLGYILATLSLAFTGVLVFAFKENPFSDHPVIKYIFGVIMIIGGLYWFFMSIV